MVLTVNKALIKVGSEQIIEISEPIKDFLSYASYTDEVTGLSNISRISREFSFSTDGKKNWTQWLLINDGNFLGYLNSTQTEIWMRFRYRVTEKFDATPIFIKSINFDITVKQNTSNTSIPLNPSDSENLNYLEVQDLADFTKPFEDIERTANKFLIQGFGAKVKYFRVLPNSEGIDTMLGEYNLKGVEKVCDIKIMVKDWDIPNNIFETDEWGLNFDQFEINVDPFIFQEVFGVGTQPRNDDFVYFYQSNLMYRVSSNHNETGANEQLVYHVLSMKKWDNDTNIKNNSQSEEFLEGKIRDQEKLFKNDMLEEFQDTTNDQQNQLKSISQDITRESIHEFMDIINSSVYNNGTELMKSHYNFWRIPNNEVAVKYKKQCEIKKDDSFSFSSWFRIPTADEFDYKSYQRQSVLSATRISRDEIKIKIDRPTKNNTIDVLNINDNSAILVGQNVYDVRDILDDYEFTIANIETNPQIAFFENIYKANLFYLHSNSSFSADLYSKNLLRLRYDRSEFDFKNLNLQEGKWYSIVVNVSNIHKYLGVYIWELVDRSQAIPQDRYSTLLKQIYKKEVIINEEILVDKAEPLIIGSQLEMGNIRAYKRTIDEIDQSYLLGNRTVKKPSVTYLIDDAEPIFNIPNIGRGITQIAEKNEREDR